MTVKHPYIYIGDNTLHELLEFCNQQNNEQFILVTDQIIYPIWGEQVETTLKETGRKVKTVILQGNPVIPNEGSLINILLEVDDSKKIFVSVGSGSITDMVRFIAHRVKAPFISLASAPSMDGYASSGSALTIQGMKQTVISNPPIAIFADIPTLSHAPKDMIAAGFGDVFGKFTALADWAMGGLIIKDPYLPEIAKRVSQRLEQSVKLIDHLDQEWERNIYALTDALLDVGLCMLETGNSRPASGSEHSCSHYWEMKLMAEGRPVSFHGTKVGLASVLIAERYRWIRGINLDEVKDRLAATPMPEKAAEIEVIKAVFGSIADDVIHTQKRFLDLSDEEYKEMQNRIITYWEDIQKIAASVPQPEEIQTYLQKVGLPTHPSEVGLTEADVEEALTYGHYLRNPFTVIKLLRMLGIDAVKGV